MTGTTAKSIKETLAFTQMLSLAGRALSVSYKARGKMSAAVSILGFGMALVPMLVSITLRRFTDAVQVLSEGRGTLNAALTLFAALASLYVLQLMYMALRSYYMPADTGRIARYIKEYILRCTCSVKFKYIENADDFRDKIAFADTYAGYEVAQSMQEMAVILQNLIAFAGLAVVLGDINPWIVAVIVVTCLPGIAVSYLQEEEKYRKNKEWSRLIAFIQHYYHDCTRLASLQEVQYQRIFPYIKGLWRQKADQLTGFKRDLDRRHTWTYCLAYLFRGSVFILILSIAALEIYRNPAVGLGAFMLVLSAAGQLQDITVRLFFASAQVISNLRYMKDFFDLENLDYEQQDTGTPGPENADIRFTGVDFTYPNSSAPALKNITVTIRQGEKIAIVGKNGSGKSTFVNLLCAMYEPAKGSITLGGLDIAANPAPARRAISAVFQDFGKYEDTLRFNITVSDNQRRRTDDELMTLCQQTGVYDFINEQPGGLDEMIGSFSRRGNNLSGGQWQKIAITRAAYRNNTRVMILDEPTAALDPVSEANLYRNFASLTGDRTALLISHRLGITAIVDRILVFENGSIAEDGSHEELLERNGLYAEMYRAQAQWYY